MNKILVLSLCVAGACSPSSTQTPSQTNAAIDSLNARVVQAYRDRDPKAYAALYSDSAIFEWPALNSVRGRAELAAMAANNWSSQRDVDLRLTVANRRVASNHATEIGAFQQSWRDSSGARMAEFGRYVTVLVRQRDGSWRMDRFVGFEDSTRRVSARP